MDVLLEFLPLMHFWLSWCFREVPVELVARPVELSFF